MDKNRILSKIDELNVYLEELKEIIPDKLNLYITSSIDKRACERLLQISIETLIDICNILVSELKFGLPSDEEDAFSKLNSKNIITEETKKILIGMRHVRNLLVHRYAVINDKIIYDILTKRLSDFEKFKKEILGFLKNKK